MDKTVSGEGGEWGMGNGEWGRGNGVLSFPWRRCIRVFSSLLPAAPSAPSAPFHAASALDVAVAIDPGRKRGRPFFGWVVFGARIRLAMTNDPPSSMKFDRPSE